YPVRIAKPGLTVPIVGANYVRPKPAAKDKPPTPPPTQARSIAPPLSPPHDPPRKLMSEPPTNPSTRLPNALDVNQQSLLEFQRMHHETARLHKQFLDNQQAALATLQALIAQQQAILAGKTQPTMTFASPPPPPAYVAPASVVAPSPALATAVPAPPQPAEVPIPVPAPVVKPAAPARDSSAILLSVVAEKTGYPADMLGLDMSLDADLGIDSIKRVEILSALQEKIPDAPTVKPEHLGTIHTLQDIVNFIGTAEPVTPAVNGALREPIPVRGASGQLTPARANGHDVAGTLLSVVAEKTGYPADMLGLDMALDADLGIDSIKRVEIMSALQQKIPAAPAVKPEHLGTLHTLRDIASFLGSAGPPITPVKEDPRPFAPALIPGYAESERASDASVSAVVRSIVRRIPIDLSIARPRVAFARNAPVWLIAEPSDLTAPVSQQLEAAGCQPRLMSWSDAPDAHDLAGLSGLILVA